MHSFKEIYFEALEPNEPMISLMREIRREGHRMALLTNNVREWEHLWRSMLPVDEIFELVIDSGFVGMRKPDPGIYELTVARLSGINPDDCLFVDDLLVNVEAAQAIGMAAVHFRDNEQAIGEIRSVLRLQG
jgi:putative hydrolase of the HAD superfamily